MRDRGADRFNAVLTVLLLAALVVLGNRLARGHLVVRRDLSADGLYSVSDATRRILGRLEDRLQVKTFFTGRIESGAVALLKARVEAQLGELAAIAGSDMEVLALDPSSSTEAALDVAQLGIRPRTVEVVQGTQRVLQDVFLGVHLRYRGREQVLAQVDPWSFEVQFASAVYALVRDRRARIGWVGPWEFDAAQPGAPSFQGARNLIGRRHDLVPDDDLAHLRYGEPVPEGVDIVLVVRPLELHRRAVFELDQFVQRGGKLVVLVDQVAYDAYVHEALGPTGEDLPPTGLEDLLHAWGAPPTPQHVWDVRWGTEHHWIRPGADGLPPSRVPCTSPLVVTPRREGLDLSHPITAGLEGVALSWAQPIPPAAGSGDAGGRGIPVPAGVERVDLLKSSSESYRTSIRARHVVAQPAIESHSVALLVDPSQSYTLAVALSGRFPSPFEAAPAPDDPLLADEPPSTTGEEVLSAAAETQVVVVGDADWLRDDQRGPLPTGLFPFQNRGANQLFLMNVLDWLTLDEELIDLRRRIPRERPLETVEPAERWIQMVLPIATTLGLVFAFGAAWNLAQRRGRRA